MLNLLRELPDARQAEVFQTVLERGGIRIERIVSWGQATPDGQWYDQEQDEWVLVLAGEAQVQLADEAVVRHLSSGDWLYLPAHCRHRVAWTAPGRETVWLALHWHNHKEA